MFKIKLTCDEATMICDKSQYGEASFWDLIKLQIHFMQCKICRMYTKQNAQLTKVYKSVSGKQPAANCALSQKDKDELKEKFKDFNIKEVES